MLNGTLFDEMLELLSQRFAPYVGDVASRGYAGLDCEEPAKARWMHRKGPFVCMGCPRRCHQAGAQGFDLVVSISDRAKRLAFAELPAVSAQELLDKKLLLNIPEVEFVPNIGNRTVYKLLDEGVLERHPDKPIRITSESVRREAERVQAG